jgi:hypothetical protein
MWKEEIGPFKFSRDCTGNRTRNLSSYGTVPQPAASAGGNLKNNVIKCCKGNISEILFVTFNRAIKEQIIVYSILLRESHKKG